jgi:bifunctional DNA-binding transcriptional regulator/antitoxin component of YhaV-PrlF toxin-antitoxin module
MTEKTWVFKKEEIFSETDEKGMVTMKIPKEISDKKGWVVGDNLKMSVGDQGTIIIEKLEE